MIKLRNGLFVVLGPLLIAATLYGGLISFLELREIGDDTVLAVSGTPVTLAFARSRSPRCCLSVTWPGG